MATETVIIQGPSPRRLSAEDFETASIRSAAPSYISEAPSYHTLPPNEAVPAYTPPDTTSTTTTSARASTTAPRQFSSMLPPMTEPRSNFARGAGLPPIPRRSEMSSAPSISQFHIPPWSSIGSGNPQARHYQSVASRRVAASSLAAGGPGPSAIEGALRAALNRAAAANADASDEGEDNDGGGRLRPLEDPYLVGEEAAARARRERLARKHGEDVLIREDKRWDFWLAQMRDVEERERSWNAFRANLDRGNNRRRLTRRFGR
ncbi:hypothetical protein SAMD00023353_4200170 [Rosellinia necatrix]|uniref:Uncharacterized protein n=1 Tax=Rosellinia necatrix TaxID=77044 RepID=A0A1W2TP53_ROSNE|nr:hypothetical protein SAMD00023353_4200170 [Rosellinia necatrix]